MVVIGKIIGINTSDGLINLTVEDKNKEIFNLKISSIYADKFKATDVFEFECTLDNRDGRVRYNIDSFKNVRDFEYEAKADALHSFYKSAPFSIKEAEDEITKYVNKISNKILKDIVNYLLDKFHDDFYIYPAATKMHHNYIGGLSYHVIGMLHLADGFLNTYSYLNSDYVYAGIILHDVAKVSELTEPINPQYSTEGQLVGHLVMGAIEVKMAAKELGYSDSEEALVLIHMLISHHGVPQFGAAKKPMVAEAMLLWYIDSIDSKFRVMEEELNNTEEKEFTQPIGVIEKTKIYKI
ncbi:MAG: HD domain-containing protein [Acholeplasmatales bacterium]|nr:HD domain-containing protein [Acholeplasmatales bacterium]